MQVQITNWGEALLASLSGAFAMFFVAIPKILGFAIILVVGWVIAALIEKALVSLLRAIHFNGFAERAGLADFIQKSDMKNDAAGTLGLIAKWFVRLIALVVAFDALGLPAVSDILRQLLMWLPNLVVALVALVAGGVAANALSRVVRGAATEGGLERPELLARVAKVAVWAFAIVVAVNQIGIATAIVNTLFMATVGALALAFGLSFGLGGRDMAGSIVRKWYERGQQRAPQIRRAVDAAANEMSPAGAEISAAERRDGRADRRNRQ